MRLRSDEYEYVDDIDDDDEMMMMMFINKNADYGDAINGHLC
jgi:hypothetical protein